MKNAFVNSLGVLLSWGYAEANGDDTKIEVPDDFKMPVGGARYDGSEWAPYVAAVDPATVRAARDVLLRASDWTQLQDVPAATRATWAAYREMLRDLPAQTGFPGTVDWPKAPE